MSRIAVFSSSLKTPNQNRHEKMICMTPTSATWCTNWWICSCPYWLKPARLP